MSLSGGALARLDALVQTGTVLTSVASAEDPLRMLAFHVELAGQCLLVHVQRGDAQSLDNALAHAREAVRLEEALRAVLGVGE